MMIKKKNPNDKSLTILTQSKLPSTKLPETYLSRPQPHRHNQQAYMHFVDKLCSVQKCMALQSIRISKEAYAEIFYTYAHLATSKKQWFVRTPPNKTSATQTIYIPQKNPILLKCRQEGCTRIVSELKTQDAAFRVNSKCSFYLPENTRR